MLSIPTKYSILRIKIINTVKAVIHSEWSRMKIVDIHLSSSLYAGTMTDKATDGGAAIVGKAFMQFAAGSQ